MYNGLANSPFHSLVFGINNLHSGKLPYFGAKCPSSAAVVQLLCSRHFYGKRVFRPSRKNAGFIPTEGHEVADSRRNFSGRPLDLQAHQVPELPFQF
jgi:hypothetical protein